MTSRLWRCLALAGASLALVFVAIETVDVRSNADNHILTDTADGHSFARLRVVTVTGEAPENGGLRPGDIITPRQPLSARALLLGEPAGTILRWNVDRGGTSHFETTTTVSPLAPNDFVLYAIFNVLRIAMLLIAMVVAVRRPDAQAARALVTFLILTSLTLTPGGAWLPDPAFVAWRTVRDAVQIIGLSQAVLYACIFPFASARGPRAWVRRFNPWYTLVAATGVLALKATVVTTGRIPDIGPLYTAIQWSPLVYFGLIAVGFWIAARQSSGSDRRRVNWAAGSICLGFAGPVIQTLAIYLFNQTAAWLEFLALTLIVIPLGLAYTILRHRTIDIGFAISRALVLTILSFSIVAAFGLLERVLGKLFIDASHIASRSVEIALALGLGFSLRSLHAQVERGVDRLFFHQRRRALAALQTFTNDVNFITAADVAAERTVEVVNRCTGASNVALYLSVGGAFGCARAIPPAGFPAEIGENDPLFVRMRASRQAESARASGSSLDIELACPMFVRAALAGALVLGPKLTGEAYDPEEKALLSELAQRVGLALDALQTIALRRELEALTGATGGVPSAS